MSIKLHTLRKINNFKASFFMEYIIGVITVIKLYYFTESTVSHKPS